MATTIKLKNSVTTTNAPTSLVQGEVAINITDKKVWVGNAATTPVLLLGSGADGTFTNLTVSGVASFADGTVSLPSITNIGDTNTGIFFPAADTIAFTEGGVESMRIDSSGNLGIGTSSPTSKFAVNGSAFVVGRTIPTGGAGTEFYWTGTESGIASYDRTNSAWKPLSLEAEYITLNTNAAERMRIDSAGLVGIGTSSPVAPLTVKTSEGANGISLLGRSDNLGIMRFVSANGATTYASLVSNATYLATEVNGAERMRIDSSGNVGIGTNSPAAKLDVASGNIKFTDSYSLVWGSAATYISGNSASPLLTFTVNSSERMRIDSSGNVIFAKTATTTTVRGSYMEASTGAFVSSQPDGGSSCVFYATSSGSQIGSINHTTTTTAFNTSSDYRLKENIAPMTGALDVVSQLKPVTYNWKTDGSDGQGFIAHELQEVVPECVTGEKDAVNEDGSIKPQGIDTSFLVATLTAALQEAHGLIKDLQARVETLEAK